MKSTADISLVEKTQRDILRYISQNNLTPNLPKEQEFVEMLGVSRIVVREALSRLRAIGVIETKKKKGTTLVIPAIFGTLKFIVGSGLLDKDTLRDLYQLRIMLEIGMADFIFANKTEALMQKLDEIVAQEVEQDELMNRAETTEERYEIAKKLTVIDIKFHSTLYEFTQNKSLMDFQDLLVHLFTLYSPRVNRDYYSRNIVSHVGLFNIIRNGTADSFRMAMRLHLITQFNNIDKILESASPQSCNKL